MNFFLAYGIPEVLYEDGQSQPNEIGCVEPDELGEDDAITLATKFSINRPEPGPYCLVEVWKHV